MMHFRSLTTTVIALGVLVTLVGCSARSSDPAAPPESSATRDPQAEIEAELAKLTPEDREQAVAQKLCPVSEEPLGSMGKPIKVTVDGQALFICCAGCEDELKQNFAAHLQKYGAAPANQLEQ